MYSDKIMKNELADLLNEELVTVLLTPDGRGIVHKKRALDILLSRAYDKAWDEITEEEYENFHSNRF